MDGCQGAIYTVGNRGPSTPRTLNVYADCIVVAFASRRVHLERFIGGAKSGESDVFTDSHTINADKLQTELRGLDRRHRDALFALSRTRGADELEALDRRNRRIALADVERVELEHQKPWLKITLKLRDGKSVKQYSNDRIMNLDSVINLLHRRFGERVSYAPASWAELVAKLRAEGRLDS